MPITAVPQYDPASVYQPVVYKCEFQIAQPDSVAYAQYDIIIDAVTIATDKKSPDNIINNGGGSFTYQFEIDIQAFLQRYLAPNRDKSSMFGALSGLSYVTNTDAFGDIQIVVRYGIKGADGLISLFPISEPTILTQAAIAKRQNGEPRSLDGFISPQILFLTNSPEPVITAPGCASFLSFYNNQASLDCLRVTLLDASGSVVSTHYAAQAGTATDQNTAGVGYQNIEGSLASEWYNGDDKPLLNTAASYLVDFGDVTVDINGAVLSYTQLTEQKLFEIDEGCGKKLKLFWLNDLGGVDNYELPFVSLDVAINSASFEKPLAWDAGAVSPHAEYDHGRLRNNITASRSYKIETKLEPSKAKWLRELLTSAEVYIVNPDDEAELWRVYPEPNTYTERVGRGLINLSFDLALSQDLITHRV